MLLLGLHCFLLLLTCLLLAKFSWIFFVSFSLFPLGFFFPVFLVYWMFLVPLVIANNIGANIRTRLEVHWSPFAWRLTRLIYPKASKFITRIWPSLMMPINSECCQMIPLLPWEEKQSNPFTGVERRARQSNTFSERLVDPT